MQCHVLYIFIRSALLESFAYLTYISQYLYRLKSRAFWHLWCYTYSLTMAYYMFID
jgi:hypothetical protein